jgi:hypothetical protein
VFPAPSESPFDSAHVRVRDLYSAARHEKRKGQRKAVVSTYYGRMLAGIQLSECATQIAARDDGRGRSASSNNLGAA